MNPVNRKGLVTALLGVAAVALIIGKAIFRPPAQSIEGVWKNGYYGDCMCPSENFFVFKDGRITLYSDTHFTSYGEGAYEDLGSGRYRVTLYNDEYPDAVWEVRPRATWWRHPPDKNLGLLRRRARLFYRPDRGIDYPGLVATAEQRDDRLRETIAEHKANKAE